jgi:hypothetical protein
MPSSSEVPSKIELTQLLQAGDAGEDRALERMAPVVGRQLHCVAHRCMTGEKTRPHFENDSACRRGLRLPGRDPLGQLARLRELFGGLGALDCAGS